MKSLYSIKGTRAKAAMLVLSMLFVGLAPVFAQNSPRQEVDQYITWFSLNSNVKLTKKWSALIDGQFRFVQELKSMQHMLRIGASYEITPKLSVVPFGYSFIWNYKYGKQPSAYVNNEQRIWQQVYYKHKVSRLAVNHRLRLEERFLQNHTPVNEGMSESDDFSEYQWRVRYRILANIPLNNKSMDPKTIYISVWDEAFIGWGKNVTYNKINQNRIFVGPGYQFTKNVSVQAGYIYQILIKSNGAKQENNSGALIQLNYNFDLTKK